MFWEILKYVFITLAMLAILINFSRVRMSLAVDSLRSFNATFSLVTIVWGVREFHQLISGWGWFVEIPFWKWPAAVLAILTSVAFWVTIFYILHFLPPYEEEKKE